MYFLEGAWLRPPQFKFWECPVMCEDPSTKHGMLVYYARVSDKRAIRKKAAAIRLAKRYLQMSYALARIGGDPFINRVEGDFGLSKFNRMNAKP